MIAMTPTRAWSASVLALGCCLALAASSEAGIVVLDNGKVLVGKIRAGDVTTAKVVIHNVAGETGKIDVPRHRVRWMDADGETLTDEYFQDHADDLLRGTKWNAALERWKIAQSPIIRDPVFDPPLLLEPLLVDSIPTSGFGFSIRKPSGWQASVARDITVFKGPKTPSGFSGRIHVFSVEASSASHDDQVQWIRDELARVSGDSAFEIEQLKRLTAVSGGADQVLVTKTRVKGRTVMALRKVCFRAGRTFFFAGYADAAEFGGMRGLMEASLKTFQVGA